MLAFEKAFETALNAAQWLGAERVDFRSALGRILAEDVVSDMDIPPFNKSAMDGYACRRADLGKEVAVIEIIPAGSTPQKTIRANQCSKIMTGAMVPEGADCVVMKEYVNEGVGDTIRFIGEETRDNICYKAEDIRAGDRVLNKGVIIAPPQIAVLASVGNTKPLVAKRPEVAVIATGSELVDPQSRPSDSQIRDSNSFQLSAQIERMGAVVTNYGIAGDTIEQIDRVFKDAMEQSDVVIVSGGVSVGDFDFVPRILKQNKMNLLFEKIAIKPGKPTVMGTSGKKYCFGLPGNPVSTFVLFELLVKPFLYKLMGHDHKPLHILMPLEETLTSRKTKRPRWLPVIITEKGTVRPIEYHGSAHINALCEADGFVCMETGAAEIKKGTSVKIRLI